ncbi:MAG TPA: MFS transporter, partial [Verrucomicrobiaceae bacterium]
GLFQTGMGAAFALWPFIASALAAQPNKMFLAAAITGVATSLPLIGRRAEVQRDRSGEKGGLWTVWRAAPELPALAFLGGFFENGTHTAITLSALALAWKGAGAISLAGVIGAGAFVVQYPIGRLADLRGPRGAIVIALSFMIAGCLPLPLAHATPFLLWVIALIWGAAGGCLYTLSMTGMAQRFSGTKILSATTLVVMSYTLGGILGPALAGCVIEWSPLLGPMLLFMFASLLGLAPFITGRGRKQQKDHW